MEEIETHAVDSSNIAVLHYNAGTQMVTAEFKGGDQAGWEYPCSREEFAKVLKPGEGFNFSIGRAFRQIVQVKGPGRKVSFVTCNPAHMSNAALEAGATSERIFL